MTLHLSVLLIFTGLTGIHSITTVSKVSVKAGGSVSIPCLYESQYTHHVKYLCEGHDWLSCSYKIKTNQPDSSGKFSISDDKQQRIFTVTFNNLSEDDTHYWCAVERNDELDVKQYFQLSVTRDCPQLSVDHQEITGFNGGDVTINCHYKTLSGGIQWCRLGGSCVKPLSGSIDGTRVTINADVLYVFTVTMSGLRTESSGWYYCVKEDLQMPVHLTVEERPSTTEYQTTTALTTTRCFTNFSSTPEPVTHTSDFVDEELTTVQSENHSVSIHPINSLIIRLSLLIIIVAVVSLIIWFKFKRRKAEQEETFSHVEMRETSVQPEVTH